MAERALRAGYEVRRAADGEEALVMEGKKLPI
jgi:hypothetical protein